MQTWSPNRQTDHQVVHPSRPSLSLSFPPPSLQLVLLRHRMVSWGACFSQMEWGAWKEKENSPGNGFGERLATGRGGGGKERRRLERRLWKKRAEFIYLGWGARRVMTHVQNFSLLRRQRADQLRRPCADQLLRPHADQLNIASLITTHHTTQKFIDYLMPSGCRETMWDRDL